MEKNALMEYLGAVCDAENALYACDEAISALNQQKIGYRRLAPPSKPAIVRADEITILGNDSTFKEIFIHVFRTLFFIVIFGLILILFYSKDDSIPIAPFSIIFIADLVLTFTLGTYLGKKIYYTLFQKPKIAKINKQKRLSAEQLNLKNQEEYTSRMQNYNKASIVEQNLFSDFNRAISEREQVRSSLLGQLKQLYDRNIIHPTFWNIVAVNQIREYLEMGVCSGLEGPDGAYAQYLQDVRTNRICDSIKDLKVNLMSALSALSMTQATLVRELRQTNDNMQEMNRSLGKRLYEMQSSLEAAQNASAAQFETYIQQANSNLKRIEQSVSTTASNQYIALRQSNVRSYLLKSPY